jgi:hypothetical protein
MALARNDCTQVPSNVAKIKTPLWVRAPISQPRPTSGIFVAMMVTNCTLASVGSLHPWNWIVLRYPYMMLLVAVAYLAMTGQTTADQLQLQASA